MIVFKPLGPIHLVMISVSVQALKTRLGAALKCRVTISTVVVSPGVSFSVVAFNVFSLSSA